MNEFEGSLADLNDKLVDARKRLKVGEAENEPTEILEGIKADIVFYLEEKAKCRTRR
jgi:hypothetical protein